TDDANGKGLEGWHGETKVGRTGSVRRGCWRRPWAELERGVARQQAGRHFRFGGPGRSALPFVRMNDRSVVPPYHGSVTGFTPASSAMAGGAVMVRVAGSKRKRSSLNGSEVTPAVESVARVAPDFS